jgi:hypothetical protein
MRHEPLPTTLEGLTILKFSQILGCCRLLNQALDLKSEASATHGRIVNTYSPQQSCKSDRTELTVVGLNARSFPLIRELWWFCPIRRVSTSIRTPVRYNRKHLAHNADMHGNKKSTPWATKDTLEHGCTWGNITRQ